MKLFLKSIGLIGIAAGLFACASESTLTSAEAAKDAKTCMDLASNARSDYTDSRGRQVKELTDDQEQMLMGAHMRCCTEEMRKAAAQAGGQGLRDLQWFCDEMPGQLELLAQAIADGDYSRAAELLSASVGALSEL